VTQPGTAEAIARAVACNSQGLEAFAAGDPEGSEQLLRQAYHLHPQELGILVNLGLAFMQQGLVDPAQRCYELASRSPDLRVRRSACKNLGFLHLWCGHWEEGWRWHGERFAKEAFLANQWRGDPLNGQMLTVWNDVGMGDAFQFVRYTKPLVERGESVCLAVDRSQVALFRDQLAWPLASVVDRSRINREEGVQIPLMSLIGLLDPSTSWGRNFAELSFQTPPPQSPGQHTGLCWASNPGDRTMHAYKSSHPERLLALATAPLLSLQTDEAEAHQRVGLTAPVRDWQHTWQRLGHCRRVVSVDTAVAHLSAGSGLPIQLLLGPVPDWRWRQPRGHEQLWYPNLQVTPLTGEADRNTAQRH
jgi:hypothetical protein